MKFRNLSPAQIAALNPRPYPGFPEYLLLDLPGGGADGFRRGAKVENLSFAAIEAWQQFLYDHYCPPDAARLLVLHQCSWAKPYDMSATLHPVVETCAPFEFVHRVVVSSVGLVPAELQLNPVFCAYDWISLDGPESPELVDAFRQTFAARLRRYLEVHGEHYWGVLALADRGAGSKLNIVAEQTNAAGLSLFVVPDREGWAQTQDRSYRDPGDRVRHPVVLSQLRAKLEQIAETWTALGLIGATGDRDGLSPAP